MLLVACVLTLICRASLSRYRKYLSVARLHWIHPSQRCIRRGHTQTMDGSKADHTWIVSGGVGGRGGEGGGTGGDGGNGQGPQLTVEDAENMVIHVLGDLNFVWTGNSATHQDIIPHVVPRLDDLESRHRSSDAARSLRRSVVPAVAYDALFRPHLPRISSNPEEYSMPFSSAQTLVLADFSSVNGGWRVDKHIHFMGDVRNIRRADIVGFGDAGLLISRNNGGRNFSPSELAVTDFGYNGGEWRIDRHLHFLADVTGDGLLDIVEFSKDQLLIRRNNGNGTFQSARLVIDDFGYGQGWRVEKHPRFVVDLTGDGRADIIGFGDNSVWVSYNNGDGTFQSARSVIENFGYGHGWEVEKHPRFVVDLTGDGRADIVGFGDNSVWVSYNNGDGTFQTARRVIDDFGYGHGWKVEKHPRFVVDLTGDGRADIIGFGENSVWISYNNGGGNFGPVTKLIDNFAYSGGWTLEKVVRYIANIYYL
ncbi:hypothetical protein B0H11DRAFT_1891642 [Mycena galericulata]|nr:hypothetical protein B0H11DRAFT_1891642 [Mycena galericulata]